MSVKSDQTIEQLENSFEIVKQDSQNFSKSFYADLFEKNPSLKQLFINVDSEAQEKKLFFSLLAIVENLRNPEVLNNALKSLGARHFQVGTLEEHYPLVGQSLLHTLALYLGDDWTSELKDLWSNAYENIALVMLEGAKNPQDYLEPELTFYEWIDLYGESDTALKSAMADLSNFQYRSVKENQDLNNQSILTMLISWLKTVLRR